MTRLDAALLEEGDARSALLARIDELDGLLRECRRAVEVGVTPSIRWLPAKAAAVVDASHIWDATSDAVILVKLEARTAPARARNSKEGARTDGR